jgi:hypothetical protein
MEEAMKTWKLAATLTMSVTMIIAGAVFAQAGHRYNKGVYYDYYERPGTVYYYETVRQPRVKRHHKRFVRDRLWRHGDRDRFVYKKYRKYRHPRVFARPWRDVTPSSSLYIGLRLW